MSYFALLDDAVSGNAKLYQHYVSSRFLTAGQLDSLDDVLQQGWQQGLHAVLFADYEFGSPLLDAPSQQSGLLAVYWFARCDDVNAEHWLNQHSDGISGISTPVSDVSHADYLHAVEQIHEAIRRGDTYQINYTTRLHFHAYGNPIALYRRLRQPVPYAALACLPDSDGIERWTLCFSPELFLNIRSDGMITTEPMKGTAPVLNDGLDEQRAAALRNDPKNRAENIMIVDLLRNDLGKIATVGGVRVPEPFAVNRFGSVWQMTTAIEAQAQSHIRAADIFRAAFPCGSITGAPKRMSMHIINQLETSPRRLYTGSIGFLNPSSDGIGFSGVFNVVIRTLELMPSEHGYQGVYGVGSGIVIDSDPQAEYEECGWKARFLTNLAPECGIFETMKTVEQKCALFDRHISRLTASAHALNLSLPNDFIQQIQNYISQMPSETCRLKVQLNSDGIHFSHAPISELEDGQSVIVSPHILPNHDYLRRFKTDRRQVFDQAWQTAQQHHAFDSLLFNSDGILLEGGRSSVFVRIHGKWHTPSLDLDILDGVMKREVLSRPQHYLGADTVHESHISRDMLAAADKICLSNALRGVFEVELKNS